MCWFVDVWFCDTVGCVTWCAVVSGRCTTAQAQSYVSWAATQLSYALGSTGRSFVVGVGVNPPVRPHHPGASCVIGQPCSISDSGPNPHVVTGALVGGPGRDDSYVDVRTDYVTNEVALDYNSGYTGLVARFVGRAGDFPVSSSPTGTVSRSVTRSRTASRSASRSVTSSSTASKR